MQITSNLADLLIKCVSDEARFKEYKIVEETDDSIQVETPDTDVFIALDFVTKEKEKTERPRKEQVFTFNGTEYRASNNVEMFKMIVTLIGAYDIYKSKIGYKKSKVYGRDVVLPVVMLENDHLLEEVLAYNQKLVTPIENTPFYLTVNMNHERAKQWCEELSIEFGYTFEHIEQID